MPWPTWHTLWVRPCVNDAALKRCVAWSPRVETIRVRPRHSRTSTKVKTVRGSQNVSGFLIWRDASPTSCTHNFQLPCSNAPRGRQADYREDEGRRNASAPQHISDQRGSRGFLLRCLCNKKSQWHQTFDHLDQEIFWFQWRGATTTLANARPPRRRLIPGTDADCG
jgi:hypothetical protein